MTVNIEHACVYQIYMHELVWRSGYQRNRVLGLRTPAEINRQEHKADGLLDGKENISLSHKHKDIGSVVENNHIIILTLKADGVWSIGYKLLIWIWCQITSFISWCMQIHLFKQIGYIRFSC